MDGVFSLTERKKELVTLTFVLDEEVTPDIFASKVALACGRQYTLRPGEGILLPSDGSYCYVVSGNSGHGTETIGLIQDWYKNDA